jgi:aminoglycoside phosphotransferase (APT) family kinase protein
MLEHRRDPILADAIEVRKLSGLSGAMVFLITKDGRHWFVRKVAQSPESSPRLRGQARKQQAFFGQMHEFVSTPRIVEEGDVGGRFYFDMEFVRGPDGTSYLTRAPYDEVTRFTDRLCEYLAAASERAPLADAVHGSLFDALYAKLCEVQAKTGLISPDNLTRLFLALDRVRRLGELPRTLCHGDLTLQNMVVGPDGKIWVLDLLDSPFEHYWQDVAKLHQDLSGGWYLLERPPMAQCVLDFVGRRLLAAATRLRPEYAELHDLLVASTFVRILPYARTPAETQFVTERITYFARQSTLGGAIST